jgi:ABC-type dipeptide/oligopeptide/nickel transport system permease subunit
VSTGASELLQGTGGVVGGPAEDQVTETAGAIAARSPLELFWRRLRQDKVALVALSFITLLVVVAIFAPLLVKLFGAHPPNEQNSRALDDFGSAAAPGKGYVMGTDGLGRDVFSRTLYGARVSLEVALITAAVAVLVGVTLGLVAGYFRGWVDSALSRVFDVLLAFPVLLLALGLGAACALGNGCIAVNYDKTGLVLIIAGVVVLAAMHGWNLLMTRRSDPDLPPLRVAEVIGRSVPGLMLVVIGLVLTVLVHKTHGALIQPGLPVVIFIIALANIPYMARIIRGQVLSLREKEFVEAAQSLGASNTRILFRHILPNLVAPIIVYTTLLIPQNILLEASLSFLGVGVQPPQASWGAMIADAATIFDTAWWYMTFPGAALLLTVLAFNLVGDGLQDALNPRSGQ